jgi:transcriptional regulator with XRE-family HTH domain
MRPPDVSPLGQLLRQTRQAHGFSLRQAAQYIRHHTGKPLSWQYLADLEQGRRQPSLTVLGTLAHGFRLDVATLLAHVGHVETTLGAYLLAHPDCAGALHTFLITALQVDFAAWDRLTRQLQGWTQYPLPPPN